jgi:16S rRNA (cytosine1402-N4)-methyltransferase
MNPERGIPVSEFLCRTSPDDLADLLRENADEPHAEQLAAALAGRAFTTTLALREAISRLPGHRTDEDRELTVRRVFQALRIAVNDELRALEAFLRVLPDCLAPGGRAAILTFHSGEDRRVKKALAEGLRQGRYAEVATEVMRASSAERHANPRSIPAKLRWARRP